MMEYEKKVMLTSQEYGVLQHTLAEIHAPVILQTNYYFDTEDFSMCKKGITCRIRAKNQKYQAVIKEHHGADCSTEKILSENTEFAPCVFSPLGLRFQGKLMTKRFVLYKDKNCKMVLDCNEYLGITDYELEVEYQSGCENNAIQLLDEISDIFIAYGLLDSRSSFIDRVGRSKSKSERFFERKLQERR